MLIICKVSVILSYFVSLGEKSRKRVVYHLRDFVALDAWILLWFVFDFYSLNPYPLVLIWEWTLPERPQSDAEIVTGVTLVDGCDAAEVVGMPRLLEGHLDCWGGLHDAPPFSM